MVRVFLKGGVWKNSEDEILKAAVQKYGKQQWARVASLLNRKTAKQAKARWHEWLDPAIRKTEWSRAEEEKLLHLAKLLPAQWKTIAPMVGRTAVQCQEHYEFLLDQASAAAASGSGDVDDASNSTGNLLRQQAATSLRPGQIDSHPETKPAKPDPIDMDEDEMEMLQEARARLANTQGKKAKRKQRERILAQAKRLADLQKRRELKQAGLLSQTARKKSSKRINEIDFAVEIPFHKPAPAGLHDVSTEDARAEALLRKRLTQVNYQKVNESQYRTRDREAEQAKRREENRLRILEESNEKYASAKKKPPPDEELPATAFRGPLTLPAPTVSDAELAQRAKIMQQQQQLDGAATSVALLGSGTTATQTLLGDYSSRPLPTPMRTTATATTSGGAFDVMREASQLRRLERSQTPLLLSSTATADEYYDNDTMEDFKLPAVDRAPDRSVVGRTPGSVATTRDELGLNRSSWTTAGGDDHSVGGSTFATTTNNLSIRELARQERRATKRARAALEAALMALPAPQYDYELSAPLETMADDDDDDGANVVETVADRADVEAAQLERQRLEAEKLYNARNSVVKRKELPRPPPATTPKSLATSAVDMNDDDDDNEGSSQKLINNEMRALLQYDAYAHPLASAGGTKKRKKRNAELMEEVQQPNAVFSLEVLREDALNEAKNTILLELESILEEKINAAISDGKASSRDGALEYLANENARVSAAGAATMVYLPDRGGWVETTASSDEIQALQHEFAVLREATAGLKRKHDKMAAKLSVTNGGYVKRGDKLQGDILQTYADLQNSKIDETVYRTLQSQETRGGQNRIERLKVQIRELRTLEAGLQKRYGDLVVEKRRSQVVPAVSGK